MAGFVPAITPKNPDRTNTEEVGARHKAGHGVYGLEDITHDASVDRFQTYVDEVRCRFHSTIAKVRCQWAPLT